MTAEPPVILAPSIEEPAWNLNHAFASIDGSRRDSVSDDFSFDVLSLTGAEKENVVCNPSGRPSHYFENTIVDGWATKYDSLPETARQPKKPVPKRPRHDWLTAPIIVPSPHPVQPMKPILSLEPLEKNRPAEAGGTAVLSKIRAPVRVSPTSRSKQRPEPLRLKTSNFDSYSDKKKGVFFFKKRQKKGGNVRLSKEKTSQGMLSKFIEHLESIRSLRLSPSFKSRRKIVA